MQRERYLVLCQCDGQIGRTFNLSKPPLKTFVNLLPEEQFNEIKKAERVVERTYGLLKEAYRLLKEFSCSLIPDSFGGYGLYYNGENILAEKMRLPIYGYIETIPTNVEDNFTNLSVLAPRQGSKLSRVMVGPIRFVNHSCQPNCEYKAVELNGRRAVEIVTLRKISPGSELLTFYGEEFFGPGNKDCLCPHNDFHSFVSTPNNSTVQPSPNISPICCSSPLVDAERVFKLRNFKRRLWEKIVIHERQPTKKKCLFDLRLPSGDSSDSDTLSEVSDGKQEDQGLETNVSQLDSSSDENLDDAKNCVALNEGEVSPPAQNDYFCEELKPDVEPFEFLGLGSESSSHNFVHCVESIVTTHRTSDKEATDWLKLIRLVVPDLNIPAFKTLKKRHTESMQNKTALQKKTANGEWRVLDYVKELKSIVESHFHAIIKYERKKVAGCDLKLPQAYNADSKSLKIFLIFNVDGVKIIKSRNNALWPVWIAIANLPPILRAAFNNIILAGLWFGSEKPGWNDFLKAVGEQLSTFEVINSDKVYKVSLMPILLVADTPAKYSVLNWISHIGYYGCCYCFNKGERFVRRHYYPLHPYNMRTLESYKLDLSTLARNPGLKSSRGVKGPSALSNFLPNLPLSAPIDYMHQIALGVGRTVLEHIQKEISNSALMEIENIVRTMKVPFEIRRSPRCLSDLLYFKASECKDWLLYIGPVLFNFFVSKDTYERFMLLSYGIRLLLTDSRHSAKAGSLLAKFLLKTKEQCDEMCFTINVHYLTHLRWQVENYGPLWCTSAFMFESANNFLSKPFTGTVNHLELIIERYVRRKNLLSTKLKNDNLVDFAQSLGNTTKPYKERPIVNHSVLPVHIDPSDSCLRSTMEVNYLRLDSLSYSSSSNAYVSFSVGTKIEFGEIVYFEKAGENICLVNLFTVKDYIALRGNSDNCDELTYVVVEYRGCQKEIFLHDIKNKLIRMDVKGKIFLSLMIDHFEHD